MKRSNMAHVIAGAALASMAIDPGPAPARRRRTTKSKPVKSDRPEKFRFPIVDLRACYLRPLTYNEIKTGTDERDPELVRKSRVRRLK